MDTDTQHEQGAAPEADAESDIIIVAGSPPYRRPSWLPLIPELRWHEDLRRDHLAACRSFGEASNKCQLIADEKADGELRRRRAVREALVAGLPAPPPEEDAEVQAARMALARDDAADAADLLSEVVCRALAELRGRRRELEPFLDRFSEHLRGNLNLNPDGQRAERLRRELADIEGPEPANGEPSTSVAERRTVRDVNKRTHPADAQAIAIAAGAEARGIEVFDDTAAIPSTPDLDNTNQEAVTHA
jgi:hypothetical protein